jgi:hypothetical protein
MLQDTSHIKSSGSWHNQSALKGRNHFNIFNYVLLAPMFLSEIFLALFSQDMYISTNNPGFEPVYTDCIIIVT